MQPYSLLFGKCLDEMPSLTSASVDLVLCDLPYGTTQNSWDVVIPFAPLWAEYDRIAKPNAAFVFTASQPFTSELVMSKRAWFKYEWIWKKNTATGHLNAHVMPMKSHENILVFSRGVCPYFPQGVIAYNKMAARGNNGGNFGKSGTENFQTRTNYPRSVQMFDSEGGAEHSTQKPVSLMAFLIKTYSKKGDVVLDNTMGSGSTGEAALLCGRRFIGIESDKKFFDRASERISSTLWCGDPVEETEDDLDWNQALLQANQLRFF